MPVKVQVSAMEYKGLTSYLRELGFVQSASQEEMREIKKKGVKILNPPRPQNGKGDVWVYYSRNGYRVIVQTSIREHSFKMLDNPAWVIIENENGKSVFYAPPLHRTKNFLRNFLNQAAILKQIVIERPLCICGENMDIVKGEFLREYRFECSNKSNKKFSHTKSVEIYEFIWKFLSSNLKTYLKYKLSRENYNKYIAEQSNKVFGIGVLQRKRWK